MVSEPASEAPSPWAEVEARDEQASLYAAIDRLSGRQREAILDRLAGLTCEQSGERLGVSRQAIYIRVQRAMAELRAAMAA
jgi:RNA polymerase sigma factor (sigma-70 family)